MAGYANNKARAIKAETEADELRRRLALLEESGAKPTRKAKPKTFADDTRDHLIEDMLARADEGESIDEIASAWNVETKQIEVWAETCSEFASAVRRARTRARAVVQRDMRQAMRTGRGLPGSLVDRVMKLHEEVGRDRQEEAAQLVHVILRPVSGELTDGGPQGLDRAGLHQTRAQSEG